MEASFIVWLLPPLLLILVALHHYWRIHRYRQSAWKGGSFSMFSEIWRNNDLTFLTVRNPDGSESSLQVGGLDKHPLREEAQTIPTEKKWRNWAREVAAGQWTRCGSLAHPSIADRERSYLVVNRVSVLLREVDFDGRSGEHSAREVARYAFDKVPVSERGRR